MTDPTTAAARLLADHGLTDPDTPTHADVIAAAELAGLGYPDREQQHAIRAALGEARQ